MNWKEWQEQGEADWNKLPRLQKIVGVLMLVFFVGVVFAVFDAVIPDAHLSYPHKDMESCKKAYEIDKNKKLSDDIFVEFIEKYPEESMRLAVDDISSEQEKRIRMFLLNKQLAVWARNCRERDGFFGPGPKGE